MAAKFMLTNLPYSCKKNMSPENVDHTNRVSYDRDLTLLKLYTQNIFFYDTY